MPSEQGSIDAHRLHASSLLFSLGRHASKLLLPGIMVLWFAREGSWEMWFMLLFIPSTVYEIVHYFTVRYYFATDELVVRNGVLTRNERHIPFARIQNIDTSQNLLHRLLKVAEVRVETASGAEPEAVLRVMSLDAIESMRLQIFADRTVRPAPEVEPDSETQEDDLPQPTAPEAPAPETLVSPIPIFDLIKLGMISNRGLVPILAAMGLAYEFELYDKIGESFKQFLPFFEQADIVTLILIASTLFVGAIFFIFTLSCLWTILRFHDFHLTRSGDDLRLSCGLFTRLASTIPKHRIQFLSVHESYLHRLFGRVTLRIETAGGGEEQSHAAITQKWFVPILPKKELRRVLSALIPIDSFEELPWQRPAEGSLTRMTRGATLTALIFSLVLMAVFRPWGGLAIVALLPLFLVATRKEHRILGWARGAGALVFRSGIWTQKTSIALLEKIQVVAVHQSPFDRRWGMAKVRVDTAGAGPAGHSIHIPYMEEDSARSLKRELVGEARESDFQW